jgi:hypothetical protein
MSAEAAALPVLTHQPGLTSLATADGTPIGLLIGAGTTTLAYTLPVLHFLGAFATLDQAGAAILAEVVP